MSARSARSVGTSVGSSVGFGGGLGGGSSLLEYDIPLSASASFAELLQELQCADARGMRRAACCAALVEAAAEGRRGGGDDGTKAAAAVSLRDRS